MPNHLQPVNEASLNILAWVQVDDLRQKYQKSDPENAKEIWEEIYVSSKEHCAHGQNCQQGAECTVSPSATYILP